MKIAFIGMGEAGSAIRDGLGTAHRFSWFDVVGQRTQEKSLQAAIDNTDLIFSTVTASQTLKVAEQIAHLDGQLVLDGNSVAPQTKQKAAKHVDAIGGRYVDCAIMAPIHPKKHQTPMLLSGPYANEAAAVCETLDMKVKVVGPRIGDASITKMLRSVAVKGLEALTAELSLALDAARDEYQNDIKDRVLDSLDVSYPGFDWRRRSAYNLERMETHGLRRAEEMEQVALTLQGLSVEPLSTNATILRQRQTAKPKKNEPNE